MGMNVLSLFDGMSCGQIALERAGIEVDNYYASEIDKFAIQVTQDNYPDTVQLGNICDWGMWDLPKTELLIGGSPCQDLSRIKSKDGKGLKGDKSKLFFEYASVFKEVKPKYFLLENVDMDDKSVDIISNTLGVAPIRINSGHFSAQDRERLYWTNLDIDVNFPDNYTVLKDIMEKRVDEKYFYDCSYIFNGEDKRVIATLDRNLNEMTSRVYNPSFKSPTLTAVCGGHHEKKVWDNGRPRKLTPLEYERLQTVPDNYTSAVSNSQRYKMLGNGWTVDVISYIFKHIPVEIGVK